MASACNRCRSRPTIFETYNRDNVTLVDSKETPIEQITETGLPTSEADYEFDLIVYATGSTRSPDPSTRWTSPESAVRAE
jgi:hypothetical protein